MKCNHCGAEVASDFRLCSYCGSEIPKEKATVVINHNYYAAPQAGQVPYPPPAPPQFVQPAPLVQQPDPPQKKAGIFPSFIMIIAYLGAAFFFVGIIVASSTSDTGMLIFALISCALSFLLATWAKEKARGSAGKHKKNRR